MNWKIKTSRFLILIGVFCLAQTATVKAQTALDRVKREMEQQRAEAAKNGTTILPDITSTFDVTKGSEIKWYNQYDFIKNIAIQKSDDKDVNFKTIGYLADSKKGVGAYVDQNINYGTTYYRLLIVFGSDMNWYSNVTSVTVDSTNFIKFYKNKGQTADFSNAYSIDTAATNNGAVVPGFVASSTVYYDFFDQQVHVRITNDWQPSSKYSLVLKNPRTNQLITKINRLPKNIVVLDPRNFNDTGLIQFELYKDKEILEEGYINIQ